MKAKARVNQTGILLSVGMIVKNEEANLPNCLEALKPLLEAIPSELIIVDTGSTDATKAIAARYTDQVYDFEWIDDFAAARNETLKYATGKWYMYLDADEWLDNCDELITFFQDTKMLAKYNCATIVIRNYLDLEKEGMIDTQAARITRRLPDTRFVSKIHEYLVRHEPQKVLGSVASHFGYTQDDGKHKAKTERNLPLLLGMLENEDSSNIPHTYLQIAREYGSRQEWGTAGEYCSKGIDALLGTTGAMRCALYQYLVLSQCHLKQWDRVLETAQAYFSGNSVEFTTDVDIHLFMAEAYQEKGDEENGIREMETYFNLRSLAESGKLDASDIGSVVLLYTQEKQSNCAYYAYAKMNQGRDPWTALNALDKISGMQGITPFALIELEGNCVESSKNWAWYAYRFNRIRENSELFYLWKQRVIRTLEDYEESRVSMAQAFLQISARDDPFALLVWLYGKPEEKMRLEMLLPVLPADVESTYYLYLGMRLKLDIEPLVNRLDQDDMTEFISIIGNYADAGEVVDDYYSIYMIPSSLRGKRWKCMLLEHILIGTDPESSVGRRNFDSYCESLQEITSTLYGDPDEEALSIIPHGHRFGIFMGRAAEAQKRGDIAEYVRQLKKAAEAYPIMAKPVKLRVDEISQLLEEERRKQEERELLYSQIKDKILALIRIGDLTNAAQILGQYEKINPKDTEVASLYRQIQNPEQTS